MLLSDGGPSVSEVEWEPKAGDAMHLEIGIYILESAA